ncbi:MULTISPECIES: tryptophan synthase subunit alpha [Thermodesulfovibrio]|jgi:tryptophan synthase alpha chain|uniref:Tryptophan synthase alpha chain n=1 Tax=Thermodesulfovibrio yellowstonii (strain ATCC 51303 / DSM 11347 / YP87) TaxID=289376 RepID=B5YJI8_THEYD|nr:MULTISPECIES: tryptophan synthase subunit alpha [Thermodesulfovibrio]ACI21893.1 tryptophan synthase, alpha subunit [Thermodesulfovibrio yellowstonii DSM 11347]MDI6864344.1 tryptophan synthase subunit alpha [Thermodesulfovibrio yellowstonii]
MKQGFAVRKKIEEIKNQGKKAFIPYIMAGDPNLEETAKRLKILEQAGADLIELGVPFSDPLADGPTIQKAAERALNSGTTLRKILNFLEDFKKSINTPIILMTYLNPVFCYGIERFFHDAKGVNVGGVIFPDLTVEESKYYRTFAKKYGIDTIFLVAPTSTPERVKKIVKASTGFVYYVSITGITGTTLSLDKSFNDHINFVKSFGKPVCVGFGVSKPEEAKYISRIADGVIVGSAIVKIFHEKPEKASEFIKSLREAI